MNGDRKARTRLAIGLKAALPGLALVAAGMLATAFLVRGWGLHGATLRQARSMAPYVGMPMLVVGVYVAIDRISNALRGDGR